MSTSDKNITPELDDKCQPHSALAKLHSSQDPILFPLVRVDNNYFKFPRNLLYRQNSKLAILIADPTLHVQVELKRTEVSDKSDKKMLKGERKGSGQRKPAKTMTVNVSKVAETKPGEPDHVEVTLNFEKDENDSQEIAAVGHRLLDFSRGAHFLTSDVNEVCRYLCSDRLEVTDEIIVFRAAHRWIRFDLDSRLQYAARVMGCVRFGLIQLEDLVKCYARSRDLGLLKIPSFCKRYLSGVTWSSARLFGLQHMVPELKQKSRSVVPGLEIPLLPPPTESVSLRPTNSDDDEDVVFERNRFPSRNETTNAARPGDHPTLILIGGLARRRPVLIPGTGILFYKEDANGWVDMKPFPTPLCLAAACFVESGDSDVRGLYVTGGCHPKAEGGTKRHQALPHLWKYRPEAAQWIRLADMREARMQHALVSFPITVDGYIRILAIGGTGANHKLLSSVEAYNPLANEWEYVSDLPRATRDVAVIYHGGQVWSCGGFSDVAIAKKKPNSSSLWILDTVLVLNWTLQKWTYEKSLRVSRARASLVSYGDSLFIVGGLTLTDGGEEAMVSSIDVWTPTSNVWSHFNYLPTPRCGTASFVNKEDLLIVAGGTVSSSEGTDVVESFDLRQNQWVSTVADLPRSLRGFAWVYIPNIKFLK